MSSDIWFHDILHDHEFICDISLPMNSYMNSCIWRISWNHHNTWNHVYQGSRCMISIASLTSFSDNTRFHVPIRIWFEEPLCTKPAYCWAPEFFFFRMFTVLACSHEMTETVTEMKGCAPAAAWERLRHLKTVKSLYYCRDAIWSLKTMFLPAVHSHGCLDRPRGGLIPFLFRMHSIFCQFIKLDVYI